MPLQDVAGNLFHPDNVFVWQKKGGPSCLSLPSPPLPRILEHQQGVQSFSSPPYLQHLGEEGDHADHDKEQAHAVDLPPLDV